MDDMADAYAYILSLPEAELVSRLAGQDKPPVNIGTGFDCTIAELAQLVKEVVGFDGALVFYGSKPDYPPPGSSSMLQGLPNLAGRRELTTRMG